MKMTFLGSTARSLSLFVALTGTMSAASILVDQDAWVQLGNPNANNNTATLIVKDANEGDTTRKAYLSFDLSGISGVIATARLELTTSLNDGSSSKSIDLVAPNDLSTLVDETTLTWNNAPNNNLANNGLSAFTSLVDNQSVANGAINQTVTLEGVALVDYLNNELSSGDGTALFILRRDGDNSGDNLSFHSGEAGTEAYRPVLVYTLVPEPSSALLLGGLAMILGFARRR
ncbi:MAG: DNRLRE domain-containing protein [Verrucomicrobiales bacterium]